MSIVSTIQTSCRDCYKCVRYCPVKAIRVSMEHAEVIDERCIKDGKCVEICPQKAKKVRADRPKVQELLSAGEPVVVSLAPSFVAAFPEIKVGQLIAGLKKLAFSEVRETAEGAEWVAREHALLFQQGREGIITSACPAVNALIYRYYPEHLSYLSPVVSPMVAHARMIKLEKGEKTRVVFIGPCIAKKAEAEEEEISGEVDAVLTFQELREWFEAEGIELASLPEEELDISRVEWARAFPVEGGLLKTAALDTEILSQEMLVITGVERCQNFLKNFEKERVGFKVIEMMACEGGCIDGPMLKSELSLYQRRQKVIEFTREKLGLAETKRKEMVVPNLRRDFLARPILRPEPSEEEIRRILSLTGKFSPQDELNCGACGYNSCREKAVAVYQGMAEAEMCMPFMRSRAESFSSFLITVIPNGVVLVDENLRITDVNPAFRRMLGLQDKLVIGKKLDDFIDPSPFVEVLRTKKAVVREVRYPEYHDLFARLSVFYLEKSQLLMGILLDLTREREQEKMMAAIREETLEKTQQVILNQMKVAQEIASLLGETTAETKVLLTKLARILRGESVKE